MRYDYEIHDQVEIPELDAFLAGYRALCEVHGMQFEVENYYDGPGYMTVKSFDGELPDLNLSYPDQTLPFVKRLKERNK